MDVTPEGILVAVGWAISLTTAIFFAFRVIPEMAARRLCDMFGLQRVTLENGREIYAVEDLDGKPIKIPVGFKTNAEGQDEMIMGYAPLPMTMTYLAADMAALKVKAAIMGVKSGASKRLRGAVEQGVADGSIDPSMMVGMLPKKAQAAIAILRSLGLGIGPTTQNEAVGHSRGSGKAI